MLWSKTDLERQLARVKADGWLPFFEQAAAAYGFTSPLLLGIASRETNCRNIVGDGGHGHGIMQIDNRSFPAWCAAGKWKDPQEAIRMGASVLKDKIRRIAPSVPKDDQLRVGLAAYNAGEGHAVRDFHAGNADRHTTGGNYSKDVLKRADVFKELMGE